MTVKAAKVVNKADGMIIYPTDAQKQASNNGYSILEKLTLANLRIDNISHSITVIDNRGGVQIRINGIVVGKPEMLALNPKDISKIDFINNPGVRYGDGIAYVIDIVTRRNGSGYTVGTDLTSALTTLQGDGMVYGKWNKGKSELSFSYDVSGYKTKGEKSKQSADYTLTDGSIYTIERNDVESLRKSISHDAKLTYNWSDQRQLSSRRHWAEHSTTLPTIILLRTFWTVLVNIKQQVERKTRAIRPYWISISSVSSPHVSLLPQML